MAPERPPGMSRKEFLNLKQDRVESTNGLIGPVNGKKSVNLHLNYAFKVLNKKDNTESWKRIIDDGDFNATLLHETLHMFGIHHEHNWDAEKLPAETMGMAVKFGSMDKDSVICVDPELCSGKATSVLSKGDIRCLQEISSRRIKNHPTSVEGNLGPAAPTAQ
jgi:hypothetical protein